eukprot:6094326-Pleurochrysis_carterae.AAC.1
MRAAACRVRPPSPRALSGLRREPAGRARASVGTRAGRRGSRPAPHVVRACSGLTPHMLRTCSHSV